MNLNTGSRLEQKMRYINTHTGVINILLGYIG